jgi:hypothetical protein
MEQAALALPRKAGVRMLVIDESHNALAGNNVKRREFLNLLRLLGNEQRIPLAGAGRREVYLAIRSDDQLENRFEPMMLPVWAANEDCCSLLASLAASLRLRHPSSIATPDMARYLLTRSEGAIGELACLAAQPATTSRLSALPERPGKPSRTVRVEAAPDAELPDTSVLAGILLGRARAVSRLGQRRHCTARCQQCDCGDGPVYLAGTVDRPSGAAAPTQPLLTLVSAATHAAR